MKARKRNIIRRMNQLTSNVLAEEKTEDIYRFEQDLKELYECCSELLLISSGFDLDRLERRKKHGVRNNTQ